MTNKKRFCARTGPLGGHCNNLAVVVGKWPVDFCQKHSDMVAAGNPQFCHRCNTMVGKVEEEINV